MESHNENSNILFPLAIDRLCWKKKKMAKRGHAWKSFGDIRLHPMLQMIQSARMNASQFPISRDQGKFHLVRRFPIESLLLSL